ncbi:MAG: hypothetical protein WBO35_01420 [Candidatus Saccharimonadales bacterium]
MPILSNDFKRMQEILGNPTAPMGADVMPASKSQETTPLANDILALAKAIGVTGPQVRAAKQAVGSAALAPVIDIFTGDSLV